MARMFFAALCVFFGVSASAYAAFPSVDSSVVHAETGLATYYSHRFEGRRTASGDTFRNAQLIAAHPTHPFGTVALVSNVATGHSVVVRIVDRGPSAAQQRKGAIMDVSRSAAAQLKMLEAGRVLVSVQVLQWGGDPRRSGWSGGRAPSVPDSARIAPYSRESEPPADAFR